MVHALDHMVIAVRDLDAGIAADLRLRGRPPRWRGDATGGGAETAVYGIVGTAIAALGTAGRLPFRAALAADTVTWLGGRSRLLMTVTIVARPSICRSLVRDGEALCRGGSELLDHVAFVVAGLDLNQLPLRYDPFSGAPGAAR
jgi:hypothetical protein